MMNDLASYEALDGKKAERQRLGQKNTRWHQFQNRALERHRPSQRKKIELPTQFLNGTTAFHTECIIRLMCRYQFQNRVLERHRPCQRKPSSHPLPSSVSLFSSLLLLVSVVLVAGVVLLVSVSFVVALLLDLQ